MPFGGFGRYQREAVLLNERQCARQPPRSFLRRFAERLASEMLPISEQSKAAVLLPSEEKTQLNVNISTEQNQVLFLAGVDLKHSNGRFLFFPSG